MGPKNDNEIGGKDKNSLENIINSTVSNKRNKNIFSELLSGDDKIVRKIFRKMLKNGHFSKIRSQSQKEIGMWEDELCQIVSMAILKIDSLGQLGKIRSAPAFIKGIIWYKCLDENKRREIYFN
jgi:hypothetical protein